MSTASDEEQSDEQQEPIEFATFLESTPPGSERYVENLFELRPSGAWFVATPDIQLHCSSENCGGVRVFAVMSSEFVIGREGKKECFLIYWCRNCRNGSKTYALRMYRASNNATKGVAIKYGEIPVFGPPLPSRLVSVIGPGRDLLLKGRRAENLGLGIGAFSYYRRIVEDQKNRLLDEIYKAAERLSANPEALKSIESAKAITQFTSAVAQVKDAIPDGLKVRGHNPLTLLHKALSKGIHEMNDEECLERAQAIRVVLTELMGNITQVMKDERELDNAVKKLLSIE